MFRQPGPPHLQSANRHMDQTGLQTSTLHQSHCHHLNHRLHSIWPYYYQANNIRHLRNCRHRVSKLPCWLGLTIKAGLDQNVRLGVIEPVPIGEPVTWCHRMVVCPKKNGNLAEQWTSRHSTSMQPERPTTPNPPSIRHGPSPMAPRRPYSTPGVDTTASPSTLMTVILPPSSPPGVAIVIVLHLTSRLSCLC